jgi:hypothetical protein
VTGEVSPQGNVVQGSRQFQYVVKLTKAGLLDLGELKLPHWDPLAKSYRIAKAKLGSVRVEPNGKAGNSKPKLEPVVRKLSSTLQPRPQLQNFQASLGPFTDSTWYWASLGLGPLLIAMTSASLRLVAGVRRRLARQRDDVQSQAARALEAARKASAKGDGKLALGEVERALFLSVQGATGLKARGMLRHELADKLGQLGFNEQQVSELAKLLEHCETTRFAGADANANATELVERARKLCSQLARHARVKKSTPKQ